MPVNKDKIQQALYDFNATIKAKPDLSDKVLLSKFPEFGNDVNKLQAAKDYSATLNSNKYKDASEFNSKFPEFFSVEKKSRFGTASSPTISPYPLQEDKGLLNKVPSAQGPLTQDLSFKAVSEKFPAAHDKKVKEEKTSWDNLVQGASNLIPNLAANIELSGTNIASGAASIIRDLSSKVIKTPELYDKEGNKTKEAEQIEDASFFSDPLGKVILGLNGNKQRMQEAIASSPMPNTFWGNAVQSGLQLAPDLLAVSLFPEAKAAEAASAISKVGSLVFNNFTKYLALKGTVEEYGGAKEKGATTGEALIASAKGGLKGLGNGIEMAVLGAGSNVATNSIMKQAEKIGLTGLKGLATKELVNLATDVAAFGLISPYSHAALEGRFATAKEIADGTGVAALFRIKGGIENLHNRASVNKALNQLQDFKQGTAVSNFVEATPESIKEVYNGKESADELNLKALMYAKAAKETNIPDQKNAFLIKAITYTKASNVKQVADMVVNNKEGYEAFEQSDLPDEIKTAFLDKAAQINKEVNPIEKQKTELGNKIKQGEDFIAEVERSLPQAQDPVAKAELTFRAEQAKKQVESYNKDLMKLIEEQNAPTRKKEVVNKPTDQQLYQDTKEGNFVTFTYGSEAEVPDVFKDKISSSGENNGVKIIRVTIPKSLADYELSKIKNNTVEIPEPEHEEDGAFKLDLNKVEVKPTTEERIKEIVNTPDHLLTVEESDIKYSLDNSNKEHQKNNIETQKGLIKYGVENGQYQKAIKDGKVTAIRAKEIIESAGLEVPKDILELASKEKSTPTIKEEVKPTTEKQKEGITFKTSKGSEYSVNEDGTTVRNKAARKEHPNDEGVQDKSDKTYYVTKEDMDRLSEIQTTTNERKKIAETPDGKIGIQYLTGKNKGKFEQRTLITPSSEPKVGLHPLELWEKDNANHFGSEITEIKPTEVKEEVKNKVEVFHGGTIDKAEDLAEGEPLFVSESESQAKEYTKENEGKVKGFKIDKNKIATEEEARDVIKKLGLKPKEEGWSADELNLFELIDPKFETSLSEKDIQKVFNELKKKGYEGVSFMDTNLKTLKQDIQNIAIFDPKETLFKEKPKENAVQKPSPSSLLQHPQEGTGETGGKRKGVEPSKQGEKATPKGEQVKGNEKEVKAETPKVEKKGSVGVGGDVKATAKALEGKNSEKLIPLFDVLGEVQSSEFNKQQAIDVINTEIEMLPDDIKFAKDKERQLQLKARLDYLSDSKNKQKEVDNLFKELEKDSSEKLANSNKKVAEAYHKAKADGSNPELVKAVEQSLKEQPKAEKPKVKTRQEKINDLVSRAQSLQKIRANNPARPSEVNKLKIAAEALKHQYRDETGKIYNEKGNIVQKREKVVNKAVVKGFDKENYSKQTNDVIDALVESNDINHGLDIVGTDGKRLSVKQNETALRSIREGKPNQAAKVMYDFIEKANERGGVELTDSVTKQKVLVPVSEYLESVTTEEKKVKDWLKQQGEEKLDIPDEHIENLINQYEAEFKAENEQPTPGGESKGNIPVGEGLGEKEAIKERAKDLANKVRGLKIKQSGAQSNILGVPIFIYNNVVETVAKILEGGGTLAQAIHSAISTHKLNIIKDFEKDAFIKGLEEATGEKYSEKEGKFYEEYQDVMNKVGKKVQEKARLEFVERNFDTILNKLKIDKKC